jgi:Na+/melibiose symporter-like transporter
MSDAPLLAPRAGDLPEDPETAARRHFERENERLADYVFPAWWFAVLAAPNVLPALFGTPFQSIVWPLAIADLAGYSDKQFLFAAVNQVAMIMSWSAPFVGSWSDRVPLAIARRFGRRRPFIVAGRFCSVSGNLLIYIAIERVRSAPLLFAGLVLMNLGGCIASPAFCAVVPDTIPLEQRGLAITVQTWVGSVCGLIGFFFGYLLGNNIFFTNGMLWKINVVMWGVDLPFFLIACNGEAGLWKPERVRLDLLLDEPKPGAEPTPAGTPAPPPANQFSASGGWLKRGCLWSIFWLTGINLSTEGAGPFKDRTYRWFWIYIGVNSLAQLIMTSFQFFWLQDCFPHGYYFFHWKVGDNVKVATSVSGLVTSVVTVAGIALMQPHWWRDRFGGRPLLLWATLLTVVVQPFSFALLPGRFTLVLLWNIWGALVGAVTCAAAGAIQMDCIPVGADGRPLNAGRDMCLYCCASLLCATGFPLLLGHAFTWFPSHVEAYNTFWVIGGLIGVVAYAMLAMLVHPRDEPIDRSCQCTRARTHRAHDERRRREAEAEAATKSPTPLGLTRRLVASPGARICDAMLFPSLRHAHTNDHVQ